MGSKYMGDLTALQLSTQRWFKFYNKGSSPFTRANHTMASDGTRVFVLGGCSSNAHKKDISLIHVFDTKDLKYPEPEPRRVPEGNASECSTEYHAKFTSPHSSPSEGEATRSELERQLSESLAERDQRIARLTEEFALKSADDRRLMRTSLVKQIQRDAKIVDMEAKLNALDELLLSRDQQIGQYEKELTNVRAKLEANESELEAVRLRLKSAEKGFTKSKAEADTIRAQTATSSVNRDEDQIIRRLQALEAKMASKERA